VDHRAVDGPPYFAAVGLARLAAAEWASIEGRLALNGWPDGIASMTARKALTIVRALFVQRMSPEAVEAFDDALREKSEEELEEERRAAKQRRVAWVRSRTGEVVVG